MKTKVSIALLVTTVLLFSACSVGYEFVIVNASDSSLEVRYTVEPSGMPPNSRVHVPVILNAEELKKSERKWKDVPDEQHRIDYKTGEIVVRVAPNQALRVADITNYPGHDSERTDLYFHIANLSLVGESGSVCLEGKQALTQFKQSDGGYAITYR
jgi:hypothetical protein